MKITNLTSRTLELAEVPVFVEPGGVADIPDDVAERLLDQPDVWAQVEDHPCPSCTFTARTASGLASHQRSHQTDEEGDR